MNDEIKRPKVGVGVAVFKDDKVLLGLRKGSHGAATWAFPGGHLEWGEGFEQCAKREVFEETGLEIKNIKPLSFTNDVFDKEDKHYVTLYVRADYDHGNLQLREPNKCEKWEWFEWSNLPEPKFLPLQHLIEQNINPFDLHSRNA